ncbi:MAG TPA: apolipoprotein N-acyltransferase [Alphaproteobacteria bacterium]|nr:apolipoprotein N-acyltransferase [Alphaproteobacteria bacterium]
MPADPPRGIVALARRVGALTGWRRAALAALLGALATAAIPPVYFVPSLLVSLPGLVWLVDGAGAARRPQWNAFFAGWWFGIGHFATGLYWIAHALLVDAARFGWLIPIVIFGLSAVLAIFIGAATLAMWLSRLRGPSAVLVLAAAWTVGEWLRGHIFTGFPWNLTGSVWADIVPMMQPAAAIGLYGLSLLTVAIAAMPATLATEARGPRRWLATTAAALLLAALWVGGVVRVPTGEQPAVPDIRLRLVQPDIPQSLKWDPALRERHVIHTMRLTREAGYERITHVIWPEAAVPFALSADATLRQAIGSVIPSGGLLLTGAPRIAGQGATFQAWNSLYAIDGSGAVAAVFDKFHLVPLGEYVPLRGIVPLEKITAGIGDFSAGPGPRTLTLPGLPPVSPLICYEVIFGGAVADPAARPGWLLNVTNDAWFGISSGPHQHFASARFRAVEEGLPLARAANNGISAMVDPYGRVTALLGLGRMGVVDATLPQALPPTLYARYGDAIPALLVVVALALAAALRRFG